MPYLNTSDEWLHQSSLLLQARPSTARIITKYSIKRPPSPSSSTGKPRKRQRQSTSVERRNTIDSPSGPTAPPGQAGKQEPKEKTTTSTSSKPSQTTTSNMPTPSQQPQPSAPSPQPRASLTLKTYDPVSGVCLKYETDKAAEVGRLVAGLGQLGKGMCGLPSTSPLNRSNPPAPTEVGPKPPSNNASTSNPKTDVDAVLPSEKGGLVDAQPDNRVRDSDPPTGTRIAGAKVAEGKSGPGTATGGGTGGKKKKKGKR